MPAKEQIENRIEIVERKWILVDKARKVIARGIPRNRKLVFVDGPSKARILTYRSKATAISGGLSAGFYSWEVDEYMAEQYGKDWYRHHDRCLEPVEVEIIIKAIK